MNDRDDELLYLGAGPLAAVLLGVALVPVRELTSAANLAFAFMALTLVVAEFGSRAAAVATALSSALSLDFFLTRPYLKLSIDSEHDLNAFVGLAVCGLIAATLGSERRRKLASLSHLARHHAPLLALLREWNTAAAIGPQLRGPLMQMWKAFPLAAAVVRDPHDRVLASAHEEDGLRRLPEDLLAPDSLLAPGVPPAEAFARGAALPGQGCRVALVAGGGRVGWLDVWGNGGPADADTRRALRDVSCLLALRIAESGRAADAVQAGPRPAAVMH